MFFDTGSLAVLCIFGLPVAGGIGVAVFDKWTKHEQRKLELMALNGRPGNNDSAITELRQEIAKVSDTSTQYDISIQHTLDQIQRRLDFIESGRSSATTNYNPKPADPPAHQIVGGGQHKTD